MIPPANAVDLYGWDTALALRLAAFNRLMGEAPDPTEWTQPLGSGPDERGVLVWRFGAWRIVDTSGSRLALELAVAPGSALRMNGQVPVDASGCVIALTVDMQLQRSAAALGVRPTQAWWGDLQVDSGDNSPGFAFDAAVTQALEAWLGTTAAMDAFNKRFSALSIGPEVPAAFAPAVLGFAGATLGDGGLAMGLLGRTAPSQDTIGAAYVLSPFAIQGTAEAAFAISMKAFLTILMLPALQHTFGVAQSGLEVNSSGTAIFNTAALSFPLTTADGSTHVGVLDAGQLRMTIDGDVLVLQVTQMTFSVGVGKADLVDIHLSFTERLKPRLIDLPGSQGGKVFTLEQASSPEVQHDDQQTLWLLGGQLLVDVVMAIVTVLISKFGPRFLVARGLSPITAKVMTAITAVIAEVIGEVVANLPNILTHFEELSLDKVPDFSRVLDGALGTFDWPGGVKYQLGEARFAGALVIDLALSPAVPVSGASPHGNDRLE